MLHSISSLLNKLLKFHSIFSDDYEKNIPFWQYPYLCSATRTSVSWVPSLRSCRSHYSPMHGVHQGVDPCNWNVIPLFMKGMSQLGQISGGMGAS